jgi:glutamate 5-kinase
LPFVIRFFLGSRRVVGFQQRPCQQQSRRCMLRLGLQRLLQGHDGSRGVVAAQVLLVPHDFVDRRQYLHARQTLVRLMELGCVPIVNENDAIASDEIRYGDNDRIAALVAHNVAADLLVLLTDTPGLYTADPRTDPSAQLLETVAADDPLLSVAATASGSNRGSGGMASKLSAARMASWSGVRAVIAKASRPDVLVDAVAGLSPSRGGRRRRRPSGAGGARHLVAAGRRDRCAR